MKKLIALVLAVAMVLSLAACGGNKDNTTAAPQPGTTTEAPKPADTTPAPGTASPLAGTYQIKVWAPEAAVELTKKQINDFNSSNADGIKFEATVEAVSEADAGTNVITDVDAAADLYFFAQDQFARLVRGGALMELPAALATQIAGENNASVVAAGKSGDTQYAFPLTNDNGYFMYYDKSVIPEEDVDSLEKLIADCEKADKYFAFE